MLTQILFHSPTVLLLSVPLLTPLFFTWSTYESFYVPKLFLLELLVILIALSLFLKHFFYKEPPETFPVKASVLYLPIAAYVAWCGLTLLLRYNAHSVQGYLLLLCQSCIAFIVLLTVRDERQRLLLCRVIISAAFIAASIGVAQYFGFRFEKGLEWVTGGEIKKLDIYSTSGNPNFLGAYLIGVLPFAIMGSLGKLDRDGNWLWFYRIAAVAILLCLVYTRTKGAWIGAGASLVYLLAYYRSAISAAYLGGRKLLFLAGLSVVLIIGLYVSGSIDWIIAEIKSLQAGNITVRGRLFLWQVTLNMITDHPFTGIGWGNYRALFQEYQGRFLDLHPDYVTVLFTQGSAESSHNEFLELAAETGLAGLFLFFLVLWTVFRLVAKAAKMDDNVKKTMTYASAAGILAVLVHSLFVFPLHLVDVGAIFWLEIGLIVSMTFHDIDTSHCQRRGGGKGVIAIRAGMVIVAVLLSGFLAFSAFRPVMASAYQKMAWEAMARGHFASTIQLAEEGIKWSALNDELYLLSGSARYQLGAVQAAISDYKKAYELYPDYMILFNLGISYQRLGMSDEAADYLMKAIFVRPNLKEAYMELLEIYASRGSIAERARLIEKMRVVGVL